MNISSLKLKSCYPLMLSTALGLTIIILVTRIVSFSESVMNYYTPAILSYENLMESGLHLKIVLDGNASEDISDNVAVVHYNSALAALESKVPGWAAHGASDADRHLLESAMDIRRVLLRNDQREARTLVARFLPTLSEHTVIHREELGAAKRNIRTLAFGAGALGVLLIAIGYGGFKREREMAECQAREAESEAALAALITALEAREPYTKGHSLRVAEYSLGIAAELGLNRTAQHALHMAGLLHDIGKIGVPDSVLLKTDKLTDEEFAVMRQHPAIGATILADMPALAFVLPAIRHHHERYDGKGYPDRLAGADIPQLAQIIAVADAFDAMTTSRPYRAGLPVAKAVDELLRFRDAQWSGIIVDAFLRSIGGKLTPEADIQARVARQD